MPNGTDDPYVTDYIPTPDEREALVEEMRREEQALTASPPIGIAPPLDLPVGSGRMYMGPALAPGAEQAFRQMPSGTSLNLAPPPSEPPVGELERLRASDVPGVSRTLSIRRDVPIPIPEDAKAAQFAMISEYQRMRAAGVPEGEAVSRVGLNYFTPQGRYNRMTPYQELSTGLRERQLNLQEQAQQERFAREARKESAQVSPTVAARYRALVNAETKAADSFDPAVANRARWAREGFEAEHPELVAKPTAITPPKSTSPRVGEVRKGYRFKGGNPNLKSSWEKV